MIRPKFDEIDRLFLKSKSLTGKTLRIEYKLLKLKKWITKK